MNIYTRNNKPKASNDDLTFSEDVIIMTEDGLLNIGYYDFKDDKWKWHTETLVDMEEIVDGKPVDFAWIYPPSILTDYVESNTK
jgi:hypothetical protein